MYKYKVFKIFQNINIQIDKTFKLKINQKIFKINYKIKFYSINKESLEKHLNNIKIEEFLNDIEQKIDFSEKKNFCTKKKLNLLYNKIISTTFYSYLNFKFIFYRKYAK